jgi:integrase
MATAQAIKAKRIVELQNGEFGFKNKTLSKASLTDYIDKIAEKHYSDSGNKHGEYYNFKSLNLHLNLYKGKNITFGEVDKSFADGFVEYLKTAKNQNLHKNKKAQYLSSNTQNKLFNKLNTALKRAKKNGIISDNPLEFVDNKEKPKAKSGTREYLTIEEVKKLIKTDCDDDHVKRSFLFCCLTGLRFSDVFRITWGNFQTNNFGTKELKFSMKKGDKPIIIQISEAAINWLPDRKDTKSSDKIFKLGKNEAVNPILSRWVKNAGITKYITFHCSRHTAATLNLSLGTPIAVVSKLLGHSKIATTQIYAKIVDEAQREAVDKQNELFK